MSSTPGSENNKHCPRKFTYNGDGIRMSQTMGRFATDYVWDVGTGTPMVLQEANREDFLRYSTDPLHTARGNSARSGGWMLCGRGRGIFWRQSVLWTTHAGGSLLEY